MVLWAVNQMTRKRLLNGSEKNNAPFTSVERQLVEMKKKEFYVFLKCHGEWLRTYQDLQMKQRYNVAIG